MDSRIDGLGDFARQAFTRGYMSAGAAAFFGGLFRGARRMAAIRDLRMAKAGETTQTKQCG